MSSRYPIGLADTANWKPPSLRERIVYYLIPVLVAIAITPPLVLNRCQTVLAVEPAEFVTPGFGRSPERSYDPRCQFITCPLILSPKQDHNGRAFASFTFSGPLTDPTQTRTITGYLSGGVQVEIPTISQCPTAPLKFINQISMSYPGTQPGVCSFGENIEGCVIQWSSTTNQALWSAYASGEVGDIFLSGAVSWNHFHIHTSEPCPSDLNCSSSGVSLTFPPDLSGSVMFCPTDVCTSYLTLLGSVVAWCSGALSLTALLINVRRARQKRNQPTPSKARQLPNEDEVELDSATPFQALVDNDT